MSCQIIVFSPFLHVQGIRGSLRVHRVRSGLERNAAVIRGKRETVPNDPPDMPKVIWFLWLQGLDNAPPLVRACHDSWRARNPGWRVMCLDEDTLRAHASADYSSGHLARLIPQHRAGLLRFDLLAHHGGVWADATTYCVRPLDAWLPPNMGSGFFAFRRPGPDRVISTWFLAATAGNLLAARMFEHMLAYWNSGPVRHPHERRRGERRLLRRLEDSLQTSARRRSWWFSRPVRTWLRAYPYFALSYGLETLLRRDAECARVWAGTPGVSAIASHHLQRAGLLSPPPAWLRAEIDNRDVPVYKTCWRTVGRDPIPRGSSLGYLLAAAPV